MAKKQDAKAEVEEFEIYEDDEGNEFVLVDGEYVPFDPSEYELIEDGGEAEEEVAEDSATEAEEEADEDSATEAEEEPGEEEIYEVFEDEEGEYILVDGERVPFDESEFDMVVEEEDEIDPDDPSYNPLAYESVQAATDVANDFARAGGSIVRDGAAIAGEMKEAMDDIKSMLDFKSWLK